MNEELRQVDVQEPLEGLTSEDKQDQDEPKETQELIATGRVKNSLYWKYFCANGSNFLLAFVVFLYIFTQVIISGSDYWLGYWYV